MEIRLYSPGLKERLDMAEKNLTDIMDYLNQMEAEAKSFQAFWDSPAYQSWCEELDLELCSVTVSIRKMNRLLQAMSEITVMLAETERNNNRAVEQLP